MTDLRIMPDLPIELVRYNNNIQDQIIFDERYFIKKIITSDYNIDVLSALCNLDIEGFNNHRKIFIDESGLYLYLIATYLDGYKDTLETILTMSSKERITLFKTMLERLSLAHKEDFNPYDIKYSNYLLDKDNKPVFTDFDVSFYKGESTYKGAHIHFEPNFDFTKQENLRDNLVINDKMEILKLFLHSLTSSFFMDDFQAKDLYDFLNFFYIKLKKYFIIPKEVEEYLSDIILKGMLPQENDYFIENLITPLEKGIELKR